MQIDTIEVIWPGGRPERFAGGPANRIIVLEKGKGQ
jgi:hypothetical protein